MSVSERLILFAKTPRLGHVKSRLVPPLTPEQALGLYEAFLSDQIRFVGSLRGPGRLVEVCGDDVWGPEWRAAIEHQGLTESEQGPGDLGERMLRAFARARGEGASDTVIVGVDSPTLPRVRVLEAFRKLRDGARALLAPAEDGGYVLIGLREPEPALFLAMPWGGPRVLEVTRARAAGTGLPLATLEPWYDIDDARGLERLRGEISKASVARRAPRTARFLARLSS